MGNFKEMWKEDMFKKLAISANLKSYYDSGWTDEDIYRVLDQQYELSQEREENKMKILLYNNLKNTVKSVKPETMLDFILEKEPITTEHGCLFAKHDEIENKPAQLLRFLGSSRKVHKKRMLDEKRKGINADMNKVKQEDTNQKSFKELSNSYYGITGLESSLFFNIHVALSITGKGRSIISTAFSTFENFLGDDIKFNTLDELLHYINAIKQEKHNVKLKGYIEINKSRKDLLNRLLNKISFKPDAYELSIMKQIVNNINSQFILNKIFYKDNIYELLKNEPVKKLYHDIIFSKSDFYDPNDIPEEINDTLNELWNVVQEYGLSRIIVMDKIEKLQTKPRSVVLGVKC